MHQVSPVIQGLQEYELTWAAKWPYATIRALPVNQETLTGDLVMRYRFSWREKLRIMFGQDLFLWFSPGDNEPQWPTPRLTNPDPRKVTYPNGVKPKHGIGFLIFPFKAEQFNEDQARAKSMNYVVKNPDSHTVMLEPTLEDELNRTLPEKLKKAGRTEFIPESAFIYEPK